MEGAKTAAGSEGALSVPPANVTGIWSVLGWESTLQAQVLV